MQMTHLEAQNRFLRSIIDGQTALIAVIHDQNIVDANKAFLEFFQVSTLEHFKQEITSDLGMLFEIKSQPEYIRKKRDGMGWLEYMQHHHTMEHKAAIRGEMFHITLAQTSLEGAQYYIITFSNITALERAQHTIEDSIEYASLIQHSLIPDNELFRTFCEDFFVVWHPRDTVGGDIYLLEALRNKDEMILMVIDCAGHGVPGAFVTMLVKAIERQIVGRINASNEVVNPAKLLAIFNRSMKHLLKQESPDSISNAGFDGGILYYNQKNNHLTYAGAKTPLYVVQEGVLEVYNGDRHSLGYKRSNPHYEFTNYEIEIKSDTVVYIGTDGWVDQTGGALEGAFGKTKLTELIRTYHEESLADQQELFLDALLEHQQDRRANDDVTFIGLRFLRYNQQN